MIQEHFPLAALVTTALPLALGNGALFILAFVAMIAMLPLVYGRDVDQIVEATLTQIDDRR